MCVYLRGESTVSTIPRSAKAIATVDAARDLFLRHGIRRITVEEICREAGVSKRTFYKQFRNRDDVALQVLRELFAESRSRLEETLAADTALEEKAREIIAVKSGLAAESDVEFFREIMTADSEPGHFARRMQREWDERVRAFYLEAQARGEIRADIDVDFLLRVLVRARDLVEDPELLRIEPDFSRLVESIMKLFFYGILPRREGAAG
jgi:AcrR family transcriptional regulator